jgi:NAD(P)-dependent dehydrogenase (short-subunit alcohol dehydrogenase family)
MSGPATMDAVGDSPGGRPGGRKDFDGAIVLVTGAGSGIGRAAARIFAQRGARVYGVGRGEAALGETRDLVAQDGGNISVAHVDVAIEEQVADLLARIRTDAGRLDIAFNNAGITGEAHRVEDYPSADFDKVVAVNLRSVFLGMKYELPLMRGRGGAICNTASVAGLTGPGGMCAYAASKHGIHGLTRVAAMENGAHNIRVNTLAPGWTETPMVATASAQNPAFAKQALASIPAKRGGRPEEVAAAAVWLCSSEASYVFGQMLVVDGGMTIGGFEFP